MKRTRLRRRGHPGLSRRTILAGAGWGLALLLAAGSPRMVPGQVMAATYFMVSGVAADDTLNLRSGPDPRSEKVGQVPFDGRCVYYFEDSARYKDALWHRIQYREYEGWANSKYLALDDKDYCAEHYPGGREKK